MLQSNPMTIDDLARTTGTTTRNVRAMQTGGLLAPPSLRGRVGTYDSEHVARVQAVLRLQARGFSRALEDILGLPQRRRRRGHAPSPFDVLAESLPTWRGPRDGLLPGPLSKAVVVD
jgi:hypothetical protein